MSLNRSRTVPVHSHSLGELIGALTSLGTITCWARGGTAITPCNLPPPTTTTTFSISAGSCHSPALHQSGFISRLFRDLSSSRLGSIVVHLSPFPFYPPTFLMHLPALLFSHPRTISPLFPLCSNEGVGSAVINDALCVCECVSVL